MDTVVIVDGGGVVVVAVVVVVVSKARARSPSCGHSLRIAGWCVGVFKRKAVVGCVLVCFCVAGERPRSAGNP